MKHIVVIGSEDFTLGFRLAGVQKIVNSTQEQEVKSTLEDASIGIVVIEDTHFSSLDPDLQEHMESRIHPVTVVVGKNDTGQGLKQLIKKSIGVEME